MLEYVLNPNMPHRKIVKIAHHWWLRLVASPSKIFLG